MTTLFVYRHTAPWAARAEGDIPVAMLAIHITLYFSPGMGAEVKGICVISDGKLSGGTSGPPKQTDPILGIVSDTVAKSWEGGMALRVELLYR